MKETWDEILKRLVQDKDNDELILEKRQLRLMFEDQKSMMQIKERKKNNAKRKVTVKSGYY